MPTPQSAILPETGRHGLFLTLNVEPGAEKAVLQQCVEVERQAASLRQRVLDDSGPDALSVSVAFGADFWQRISPQQSPRHLQPFAPLGSAHQAVATGGDVLLHCHSNRPDFNFDLAQFFLGPIKKGSQ